jgi:hypothetical protein
MALVEEVFPGGDRKAKIRTSKGVYKRPIAKLCLIATRQELEQNETLVQHSKKNTKKTTENTGI